MIIQNPRNQVFWDPCILFEISEIHTSIGDPLSWSIQRYSNYHFWDCLKQSLNHIVRASDFAIFRPSICQVCTASASFRPIFGLVLGRTIELLTPIKVSIFHAILCNPIPKLYDIEVGKKTSALIVKVYIWASKNFINLFMYWLNFITLITLVKIP